ncbi:MAG: DUF1624 domain-containing protein [Candidatus Omnitrophica bacterium]|nr:DUF1624 domain-containing protein [Candidatus Omnitrophota bacterium]MBU1808993.1 DUF1624 domain-containing protein [Candidatus Omnitrophota bacterium]
MKTSAYDTPIKPHRMFSIDIVRGLAMVFMTLDHTRDYFSSILYSPTNLSLASAAMFSTRWITNFCAPAFIFLAGTASFLYKSRGRTNKEVSIFLFTRGLWIVFLEFTLVQWGWAFSFSYNNVECQVMWAIGWSMVALACLIFLHRYLIMAISILMIAGHNLLDGITASSWGPLAWLIEILHVPGSFTIFDKVTVHILYPLIPWIGVMALGYAMGPLFLREARERKEKLLKLGIGLLLAFIVIRAINVYGDPQVWSIQKNALYTFLSFINIMKYPPSFLFLSVNFGILFILLSLFDKDDSFPGRGALLAFGRTPLFYYLIHLPVIHFIAVICAYFRYGNAAWLFNNDLVFMTVTNAPNTPQGYGYGLPVIYLVWILVVIILYPACRLYADVKKKHPNNKLLSYI